MSKEDKKVTIFVVHSTEDEENDFYPDEDDDDDDDDDDTFIQKKSYNTRNKKVISPELFLPKQPKIPISKKFLINKGTPITDLKSLINAFEHPKADEKQKDFVNTLRELDSMVGMHKFKEQLINQILFFVQDMQEPGMFLHTVLMGPPGCGKCLGFNTPVLMADKTTKMVQDIKVGDQLLGDDNTPRNILSTCKGQEQMYTINQSLGNNYIVNESHILSLKLLHEDKIIGGRCYKNGQTIDISIKDYIKLGKNTKEYLKGYKFYENTSQSENEKENEKENIIIENQLKYITYNINVEKVQNVYYSDKPEEYKYYYGFEIDGNHRFLLGDYTVTHNTSCCNILAKLYSKIGILDSDKIVKADRASLIGKWLGSTAIKTRDVLESAKGGVLLIDEVYALGNKESGDSFSKECIDTINQYLSEHVDEFICVIAGYKDQIDQCFFSYNPGLERRFPWKFAIDEYKESELSKIMTIQLESTGWKIDPEINKNYLDNIISINKQYFSGNGGDTRNLIDKCKICHARRVFTLNTESKEDTSVKKRRVRNKKNGSPNSSPNITPCNAKNTKVLNKEDIDAGLKSFIESKKKQDNTDGYSSMYV